MINEARLATYLVRAKEAIEMAENVEDDDARESWSLIAEGYRSLIRHVQADKEYEKRRSLATAALSQRLKQL